MLSLIFLASALPVDAAETFSGQIVVGGRNVDVDGDQNKYRQHVNLDSGARLMEFGIVFEPSAEGQADNSLAPDRVEVSATGLGGDPYQSIRLGVRKYGSYNFSYQRQESEYFYQDILIDPADENPVKSNGGDFHHFDFDRIRERVDFDVQLSERAKILLGFNQTSRKGESTTVLDISREEFELEQPLDQTLKNYEIGFEYRWDKVALTLNQRWREFDNEIETFLIGASEGSSPDAPTRLDSFFLQQPYGYQSSESRVGMTWRPTERWDLQANFLSADLDMDVESLEQSMGLDFRGNPLQDSLSGDGASDRTIRQFYLSSGYALNNRLRLKASVRDQDLDQHSDLVLDNRAGLGNWHIDNSAISLGLEAIIFDGWTLSGGWTGEQRDTDYQQSLDGSGRAATEQTESDGYYLMLGYRPGGKLSLNLSAEDNRIDDPFSLSSPTDSLRYRLRMAYQWTDALKVSASYAWRRNENQLTHWLAESEQANLRLTYSNDSISLSLGAAFVDFDRSIDQLVTAGSRQVLFPIFYQADSDFQDGLLRWQLASRVDLVASYRRYDNAGSFTVKRDDARLAVNVDLNDNYRLSATYRNIDYREDFEAFDTDIWELSVGLQW